jgi:hypothetical protein
LESKHTPEVDNWKSETGNANRKRIPVMAGGGGGKCVIGCGCFGPGDPRPNSLALGGSIMAAASLKMASNLSSSNLEEIMCFFW